MKPLLILNLVIIFSWVKSARILGVYPLPFYSHYQLSNVIFKELAKRGNEVTVLTPFEEINPPKKYKQILVSNVHAQAEESKASVLEMINLNIFNKILLFHTTSTYFTELALSDLNVKKFLQEKHNFDLVIFQEPSQAYNGFCYHFNAPCIAISSLTAPNLVNRNIGNPAPPSYVPQIFVNFPANMNFFQRFYNAFVYTLFEVIHYFYLLPKQNEILQRYFPNAPHLNDLCYNISLLLLNSHISINDAVPSLPNIIDIAGVHIAKSQPLPSDLQRFLDNAKDGVIFFSMGSILLSKNIPSKKLNTFLNVFSKLKQKVLFKWENETLQNKPNNVKVGSWFPQQDVLAHPNVVLFITHGGLMSTIEAVYNGIPILGIPMFSDQEVNTAKAESAGYGKCIPYHYLNKQDFQTAIIEILRNPVFKENAKTRSLIMKDQIVKPLDNAIFWIEYVLKHRGAPHLKFAALNLTWYQYYLLDVIISACLLLLAIVLILKVTFQSVWNFCFAKKEKNETKKTL